MVAASLKKTLLPDELQAPVIITFHMPQDPWFHFQTFYDRLKDLGYVIYPGKLTVAETFRIGCIGRLNQDHMRDALAAIAAVTAELKAGKSAEDIVATLDTSAYKDWGAYDMWGKLNIEGMARWLKASGEVQ